MISLQIPEPETNVDGTRLGRAVDIRGIAVNTSVVIILYLVEDILHAGKELQRRFFTQVEIIGE